MKNPRISVIIPAHNEEGVIKRSIKSVLDQTFQDFEIVVVNDGSTDRTKEIVENYVENDKRIKIISSKTGHSGAYARNKGSAIAEGEILVFLDADALISEGFLKMVDKDFKDFKVDGLVHPKKDIHNNFLSKCIALMAGNSRNLAKKIGKKVLTEINDFNIFIFKKEAFEKIGKYDDKVLYYDDTDITQRFYDNGYNVILEPEILLYSIQPDTLNEFYRRYKWSGEGIVVMKDKKERKKEASYLTFKFFLIIVPFILLFFSLIAGFISILLVMFLTYLFNLRTNKNIIWSFLMIPITYLKNIVEFGSMIWHYFFPRKNTRD